LQNTRIGPVGGQMAAKLNKHRTAAPVEPNVTHY
jgi:hypothetical protein